MDDPDTPDPWARQPLWTASGLAQQQLPRALYVVATPIGNAADVTLRALWVLRNADCIAAEDTRVTAPLLKRYGISTRLVALHRHNERGATGKILARLSQGERIALVSGLTTEITAFAFSTAQKATTVSIVLSPKTTTRSPRATPRLTSV